jgi:uncharacterized protein YjdB
VLYRIAVAALLAVRVAAGVTLVSSPDPSAFGQPVTLTATASGTVAFYDSANILGIAPSVNGQAVLTTSLLSAGAHSLRAYSAGQWSPVVAQLVGAPPSPANAFPSTTTYPVGGFNGTAVVADFNGDGIPDLAYPGTGNNVAILPGKGDGTFGAAILSPTAGLAGAMVVADFNLDGKPDLAVVNGNGVSIMLGNGDGTFQKTISLPVPSRTLAVGDFNGDGKPDLVVANNAANNMSILLGNGDGTFRAPMTIQTAFTITSVAVADFNGDGIADLAIVGVTSKLNVLLGNGDGTFQTPLSYALPGQNPTSLVVADFNGDGKADLAIAQYGLISIQLGNGDGTFQTAVNYSFGQGTPSFAVADFNADGKPDLIVVGVNFPNILLGNGDGTFQAPVMFSFSGATVAVGDFNGDGKIDVALSAYGSAGYGIVVALGALLPPTTTTLDISPSPGYFGQPVTLTAKVSPATATGTVTFLSSGAPLTTAKLVNGQAAANNTFNSTGSFTLQVAYTGDSNDAVSESAPVPLIIGPAPTSVLLSTSANPVVENNRLILTATISPTVATGAVAFYQGNTLLGTGQVINGQAEYIAKLAAPGTYSLTAVFGGANDYQISSSNAITEVVTAPLPPTSVILSSSANPSVYGQSVTLSAAVTPSTATGTVTFYDGVAILGTAPVSNGRTAFTTGLLPAGAQSLRAYYAGDANNAAGTSSAISQTVNGNAANRLRLAQTYSTLPDSYSVAVADFNGDGISDIVYADLNAGAVSVLLGRGDGTFAPVVNSNALNGASKLVVADFNGDGKPDVAVAGYAGIVVLLGNGDGTFQAPIADPGVNTASPMVAGDFNGDGKPDVAAINGFGGVTILLGNGDGTFQLGYTTAANLRVNAIAIGDFNADGIADLAAATATSVAVMLGNGDGTFLLAKTYAPGAYNMIAVGDFNGDGKLDIAAASGSVTVLLGNGDGTFQTPVNTPAGLTGGSLAVGDFNGDGKLGLAGTIATGFGIFTGNGDGTFQPSVNYGLLANSLAVGEFNGDGKTDVAALTTSASLSIYLGDLASPTSVSFTSSLNPSNLGQAVTLTASVSPASVTGSVTFEDGATVLGSAAIVNGRAQFTTISLGPGPQSLQAFYSGDAANLASTSAALMQFVGPVPVPANTLATPLNFSAGLEPLSVAAGDFNGDGKPDLAIANFGGVAGGSSVSVLLGNGDGTFQPAVDYLAGNGVSAVAIADVNGDGKADLVVTNYYDGTVSVLLGNGDGTFQSPLTFAAGKNPLAVAIGDFNRDGIPDVAVADFSTTAGSFSVLLGNGDGTFQPAVNYAIGRGGFCIAAGDLYGDGVIDLAVGTYFGVQVYHGNGDGTFVSLTTIGGDVVYSVALADFNGDGHPDVAFTSYNDSDLRVALNTGYGSFQTPVYYATGSDPRSVVAADFDGDGHPDIAVANFSGSVSVLAGKGDGTFRPAVNYSWNGNPTALAAADVNSDGRMDLIVANENNSFSVLLGSLLPVATTTLVTTPNPSALGQIVTLTANVTPADATGYVTFYDGLAVLGSNAIVNGQATVHHRFTNNVTHSLTASYAGSATYLGSTSAAINQVVNLAQTPSTTTLTSSINAAIYGQPITLTATINHSDATGRVTFFDGLNVLGSSQVNNKATLTIILPRSGTRTLSAYYSGDAQYAASSGSLVQVIQQTPAVSFQTLTSYSTGRGPFAIAAADLNLDGKMDLAIANSADNTVSILLGNGDGTFQPAVNYPAGIYPYSIVAGDFNGDGKLDLAVANNGGNNISILLGNGDGTFQPPTNLPSGHAPYALLTGDFNRDGNLDLAVVNLLDNDLSILLGNGDGTFQLPVNSPGANHPDSLAVTDWNGDGIPDLAVANQFGGTVTIYYGKADGTFALGAVLGLGTINGQTAIASGTFGLAVTSYSGNVLVIPLPSGPSTVTTIPVGQYPWALASADVDAEGLDDLIAANEGSNNISVLLDRGAFQPAVNYSTGAGPVAVTIADFNGDGKADIAVVNYFDNTVTVLLGNAPSGP